MWTNLIEWELNTPQQGSGSEIGSGELTLGGARINEEIWGGGKSKGRIKDTAKLLGERRIDGKGLALLT